MKYHFVFCEITYHYSALFFNFYFLSISILLIVLLNMKIVFDEQSYSKVKLKISCYLMQKNQVYWTVTIYLIYWLPFNLSFWNVAWPMENTKKLHWHCFVVLGPLPASCNGKSFLQQRWGNVKTFSFFKNLKGIK